MTSVAVKALYRKIEETAVFSSVAILIAISAYGAFIYYQQSKLAKALAERDRQHVAQLEAIVEGLADIHDLIKTGRRQSRMEDLRRSLNSHATLADLDRIATTSQIAASRAEMARLGVQSLRNETAAMVRSQSELIGWMTPAVEMEN